MGDGSTGNIGGINRTADDIAVAVDNTSIEVAANIVQVKDLGVSTAKLAATSVTAAKLGNIAGNGLTGGSGAALAAQADATGGANLARAINVSANGIAVKVDDATITANASNQLIVKVDGIDKTKLAADVAGVGIAQAAGGELDLDINGLTAEVTVAADDYLAIWDTSASALRKMTRTNLLSGVAGENINQYMHLITAGEVTAGYLTLPPRPRRHPIRTVPEGVASRRGLGGPCGSGHGAPLHRHRRGRHGPRGLRPLSVLTSLFGSMRRLLG